MSNPRIALRFHAAGREELGQVGEWYFARDPDAGINFALQVDSIAERIRAFPHIGRTEGGRVRSVRTESFPFRVYYLLRSDEAEIIAIAHASRKPGYWRDRT